MSTLNELTSLHETTDDSDYQPSSTGSASEEEEATSESHGAISADEVDFHHRQEGVDGVDNTFDEPRAEEDDEEEGAAEYDEEGAEGDETDSAYTEASYRTSRSTEETGVQLALLLVVVSKLVKLVFMHLQATPPKVEDRFLRVFEQLTGSFEMRVLRYMMFSFLYLWIGTHMIYQGRLLVATMSIPIPIPQ